MQKKIIALAVAGLASSAAFAQTNVVVYGVADGTFDYVWQSGSQLQSETTTLTVTPAGAIVPAGTGVRISRQDNDVDFTRVSANSSYVGFKGSEDLGNGLKALFQYEMTVRFDTGSASSPVAPDRDSFVGLSHDKAGTIVLGNLTGPTRALGAALDVNPGATGIGANSGVIGKIAGSTLKSSVGVSAVTAGTGAIVNASSTLGYGSANGCGRSATCTSIFDTRWANSIAYLSPNWGGFSFAAAYVANENKTPDYGTQYVTTTNAAGISTVTANPFAGDLAKLDTWGYDLGIKWEGMGFMAAVTYNWAQLGDWVDTQVDNLRVGGMYTAPNWSVRAMWEKTKLDLNNGFLASNTDQQKFGLGGTFNIGKTTLLAQWYGTNSAKDISQSKANLYEVGALYNLSKRTMLKATWAMIDNQDNSAADFGVNAIGNTSFNSSRTVAANAAGNLVDQSVLTTSGFGARNQGVQVGVRHSF